MALIKNEKYYRISGLNFSYYGSGHVNIQLEIYNSEADRIETKEGKNFKVAGYIDLNLLSDCFNLSGEKDIREKIYTELKNTEELKDAKDAW